MRELSNAVFVLLIGIAIGISIGKDYRTRADLWQITSNSVTRGLKGDSLVQR